MLLGKFAVVAYPALDGNSGIMAFIANRDNVVYQKDLGVDTRTVTQSMSVHSPDKTWTSVKWKRSLEQERRSW